MNTGRRGFVTGISGLLVGALLPATAIGAPVGSPTDVPVSPAGSSVSQASPGQVGRWRVAATATGGHTLTWRSPAPLPVTDARPEFYAGDRLLGAPELSADGRTLTLTVDEGGGTPDPADLDVMLSGQVLDSTADESPDDSRGDTRPAASGRAPLRTLAADPGAPGAEATVSSSYRLPGVRLRGMPAPVEMLGHVVRPSTPTGPRPLVLFLHGRHEPCYRSDTPTGRGNDPWPCPRGTSPVPSHRGYRYVQRLLASQGYVTVSISANGINAQDFLLDDGGAAARAALVRRHLDQWARWAATGRFAVDLTQVVLVGHSRGGEGVDQAAVEIPLAAPYRVVGQVLLAPTNFGRRVAAYVPTVTLLPYCDGDVVDLQGQTYTDLARDVAPGDTALRSSVLVMGANHNFFNTEWTPGVSVAPSADDGRFLPGQLCRPGPDGSRLSAAGQRRVGRAYVAGAVAMVTGDPTVAEMFDGGDVGVPSTGGADVRVHALGGGRDLRRPGTGLSVAPGGTADARVCAGRSGSSRAATCGRQLSEIRTPHWVPDTEFNRGVPSAGAVEVAWSRTGQDAVLALRRPMDLSGSSALDLRTAVDPRLGDVRVRVRVVDGSGAGAVVTSARGRPLSAMPGGDPTVFGKVWAQTLRVTVPPGTALDLTDVRRIELVGTSARGRVWVLDAAAVRPGLEPVPAQRLPQVSLGALNRQEGHGGPRVARVPFRVTGAVDSPATFVVVGQNVSNGRRFGPLRVTLRAGQASGAVPVPYTADRVDDLRVQHTILRAVPLRGVMTSRYLGRLRLLDDDASPRVRVRPVGRAAEGSRARWQVTLSRRTDYDTFVVGNVVAGSTSLPRLVAADVPRGWLRERFFPVPPPRQPLHQGRPVLFETIPAGRTGVALTLPLRRDGVSEGDESVTLRVRTVPRLGRPTERTVTVTD